MGLGRVHDYKTDRCGNFLDITIFGHWDMRKRGFLGHSEDLVLSLGGRKVRASQFNNYFRKIYRLSNFTCY